MNKITFKISFWQVFLVIGLIISYCNCGWAQPRREKVSRKSGAQTSQEKPAEISGKVYDKLEPVIVNIICDNGRKNGSGTIIGITPEGRALILTACHVVAKNFEETDPDIGIKFYQDIRVKKAKAKQTVPALIYEKFVNKKDDLALVIAGKSIAADRVISYTFSNQVKPGQNVAALGYPAWLGQLSETVGNIISTDSTGSHFVFNAQIAPGNSGGPLIDQHGRMIGIVTSVEEGKRAFAIRMDLALSIADTWLNSIKLKERWERQKYASAFERTYKDWRFITGEAALIGGVIVYALISKDEGFPLPPPRPDRN
jgi:S1-C subfamily serine protease